MSRSNPPLDCPAPSGTGAKDFSRSMPAPFADENRVQRPPCVRQRAVRRADPAPAKPTASQCRLDEVLGRPDIATGQRERRAEHRSLGRRHEVIEAQLHVDPPAPEKHPYPTRRHQQSQRLPGCGSGRFPPRCGPSSETSCRNGSYRFALLPRQTTANIARTPGSRPLRRRSGTSPTGTIKIPVVVPIADPVTVHT